MTEMNWRDSPVVTLIDEFTEKEQIWKASVGSVFPQYNTLSVVITVANRENLSPMTKHCALRYLNQLD